MQDFEPCMLLEQIASALTKSGKIARKRSSAVVLAQQRELIGGGGRPVYQIRGFETCPFGGKAGGVEELLRFQFASDSAREHALGGLPS